MKTVAVIFLLLLGANAADASRGNPDSEQIRKLVPAAKEYSVIDLN